MINQITVIGNLTRSPELKRTPKGTAVVNVGLALNERWKTDSGEVRERTTYIDAEAWGRTAEVIAEYKQKGQPLAIVGKIGTDTWTDKTSGEARTKTYIRIDTVDLLLPPKPKRERAENSDSPATEEPVFSS